MNDRRKATGTDATQSQPSLGLIYRWTHINKYRATAFTLIELLVVIVLTALIMTGLFPVLSQTRSSARKVQCVSNMRQLAMAAQLYWDENQGTAFRYRGPSINDGDVYWFGWLKPGIEGKRVFDPKLGALYPYLRGSGVEICHSLKYSSKTFKLKATGAAFGYGYNLHLSRPIDQAPFNLARLRSPSETAVFADAAQVNTFQAPASPASPLLEEFYYVSTNEPTAHFRHQQTATVGFCDGHVTSQKPAIASMDTRMPREFLGRLPSHLLATPDE